MYITDIKVEYMSEIKIKSRPVGKGGGPANKKKIIMVHTAADLFFFSSPFSTKNNYKPPT